jgi:hypothetical protein
MQEQRLTAPYRHRYSFNSVNLLITIFLCVGLTTVLLWYCEGLMHWFVIPVTLCGVLIGVDAVGWIRGRFAVFDPIGCIGLFGFHFFYLAPLLHVVLDYWMSRVVAPNDWRDWLGWMGLINVAGLGAYRVALAMSQSKLTRPLPSRVISTRRFRPVLIAALLCTAFVQLLVYRQFGGVLGYMQQYAAQDGAFQGMGFTFLISESFPILSLMGYAVYVRAKGLRPSWTQVIFVLLMFFCLRMLFGGLRGSRSNTIWALFWGAGIVHFWVRNIPRKLVCAGLAFLVAFMYMYGFYKGAGLDAVRAFDGASARSELVQETGRSLDVVLLGDLGRSDIQAYLLYRLSNSSSDYHYSWGRTYLGAVALLIPQSVWPDRPLTKVKEGTEAQYGMTPYTPGMWQSSRIYGLAGEAMLNFGPLFVPLAYMFFGLFVASLKRYIERLQPGDVRLLIVPFIVCLCFICLSSDSDNVVFVLIKNGAIPALVLFLSSLQPISNTGG